MTTRFFKQTVRATTLALLVSAMGAHGCTLGRFDRTECASASECRASFGLGYTCGGEGYCQRLTVTNRCGATYPEDLFSRPERYKNTIVIGSLMDRASPKKAARERSARLAAIQVNQAGGLDGHTFGFVFCTIEENINLDNLTLDEAAVASAKFLAKEVGVPAIVGPSGSTSTAAVYQSLVGSDTVIISPSATSETLTDLDTTNATDANPGMLWRTAPSDSFQGPAIAADMLARGTQRVAVIHQTDTYGQGLANSFTVPFEASGGDVTLYPFVAENDRTEAITSVSNTAVDEVLFIASNSDDIVAFLNGAGTTTGYETKAIFLTDAAASSDVFLAATGGHTLFERIRGTRVKPLGDDDFAYKAFVAGYQGEYGEDVKQYSFTAQNYDAAWLVFYGSAWSLFRSGRIHGRGIAQGMRKVSCVSDGITQPCSNKTHDVIPSNWVAVVEYFRAGTAIEINGASGQLDFDPATEETSAELEVWTVAPNGAVEPAPAP